MLKTLFIGVYSKPRLTCKVKVKMDSKSSQIFWKALLNEISTFF